MAGKADLVDDVVNNVAGLSKRQATAAFEAIFDAITDRLKNGDRVQVPGFGSFSVAVRDAREGRNPKTGATIKIAKSSSAKFKQGKELKDALN